MSYERKHKEWLSNIFTSTLRMKWLNVWFCETGFEWSTVCIIKYNLVQILYSIKVAIIIQLHITPYNYN